MHVTFVGTGEAFDDELPNTSVLVRAGAQTILVDCGFSAVQSLFAHLQSPEELTGFYATHLHADHVFGLPALLVRLHEEGRLSPLALLGSKSRFDFLVDLLDRAYPGFSRKLSFPLHHVPVELGGTGHWQGIALNTARTVHGAPNFAVRFDFPHGHSLFVSGDGEVTPESAALLPGSTLVVHEAYRLTDHTPGHSSVREVLAACAAAQPQPGQVALVHTSRTERSRLHSMPGRYLVPRPGTMLTFS